MLRLCFGYASVMLRLCFILITTRIGCLYMGNMGVERGFLYDSMIEIGAWKEVFRGMGWGKLGVNRECMLQDCVFYCNFVGSLWERLHYFWWLCRCGDCNFVGFLWERLHYFWRFCRCGDCNFVGSLWERRSILLGNVGGVFDGGYGEYS